MPTKNVLRVALISAAILLIPLVGTQVSEGWKWDLFDFIVMGTLLFVTGLLIDLALRKTGTYRIGASLLIVFLFLWLWAELAVGIFTNWGS